MAFPRDKENLGDAVYSIACLGGQPWWLCCCHHFTGGYDKWLLSVSNID